MSEKPNRFIGDIYLLGTIFLWGNTFPTAKIVLTGLPPTVFVATRFVLASMMLLLILRMRGSLVLPRRQELPALVIMGFIGITLNQTIWSFGLTLTTASKAAVLIATAPIFTNLIVIVRRALGRGGSLDGRLGMLAWCGILLSFGGVFLVLNNSLTSITLGGGTLLGDLCFLAAALLWALYSVLATPYLASMGALRVSSWSLLFGSIGLVPLAVFGLGDVSPALVTLPVIASFLFTSIGSAALGNLWWYEGISRLGVARSAVYSYLIPVVAVISSTLLLDEEFTAIQALGALVVLAGVAITRHFTSDG